MMTTQHMTNRTINKSVCGKATSKQGTSIRENSSFCLHDDRITVLPFGRKELYSAEYIQWMNDPRITRTIGRFDYLFPVSRKKLIDYYRSIDRETTLFAAIYLQSPRSGDCSRAGRFIGTLKIYDIDLLSRRASLGIMIGDTREWGKGHAQRAITMASSYIFDVLGLRKITAGYIGSNKGVETVFLKTGFRKEAVFKKHLFFEGKFVDHVFVSKFRS